MKSTEEVENIIFFQGKTQYENTGDILINKSLVQLLRQHGSVIINDAGMPDWYVQSIVENKEELITSKKESFNYFLLKMAIRKDKKVFLIAGPPGHLFGNSGKKAIRNFISANFFMLLRSFGVKIIKIGFSIGPVGKQIAISERYRAYFTDYYLVRDSLSLTLSRNIGIKKADFFPDLAWTYITDDKYTSTGIRNKIVLSFRDSIFEGQENTSYLEKLRDSLFEMLKHIENTYEVVIVYQVARDRIFCKRLFDELSKSIKITFDENQVTLDNAGNAYSDASFIITNRLHGALLAYKYDVLPIILTDANDHLKIKGIFQDANIDELIIDINSGLSNVVKNYRSVVDKRFEILSKMKIKEESYKSLSSQIFNKIFR